MMVIMRWLLFLPLLLGLFKPVGGRLDQTQATPSPAVVRAVLFYSPNCGHCHYVIQEVLTPLSLKYGDQLQIVGVDVATESGFRLFQAAWQYFHLDGSGVPFLVIGDTYLLGSLDIPEQFPGLVEKHLAQGGLDWPAIPGLAAAIGQAEEAADAPQPTAESTPAGEQPLPMETSQAMAAVTLAPTPVPATREPAPPATSAAGGPVLATRVPVNELSQLGQPSAGMMDRFMIDPVGNGLSVIVLIGMIWSLWSVLQFPRRITGKTLIRPEGFLFPLLCLVGMGVAAYLAYVETSQSLAVCGPVGDCNTVQQSEYARLFGVLPIGVLGLLGYIGVLAAWLVARYGPEKPALYATLALFAMTLFGVLFSIYLTFLEPFVIGATCAWCLTSAVIMTALLWLSLAPGKSALKLSLETNNAFSK